MKMSDEQFEHAMRYFDGIDERSFARQLRARDTAQLEDLARLEAERDEMRDWLFARAQEVARAAVARDNAQAQLAEAVRLLKALNDNPSYADHVRADDFLARHAQVEQQEECAQAGDDIAHMQSVMKGADDDLDCARRLIAAGYRRPAAHGDEAVLDVLKTAYESGYQDGQDAPNAYSDEKLKHRIALSLLEEMMADAAMRAKGDGEVQ